MMPMLRMRSSGNSVGFAAGAGTLRSGGEGDVAEHAVEPATFHAHFGDADAARRQQAAHRGGDVRAALRQYVHAEIVRAARWLDTLYVWQGAEFADQSVLQTA